MLEYNCRVFQLEYNLAILFYDKVSEIKSSTIYESDAGLEMPRISDLKIYPYTNKKDVEKKRGDLWRQCGKKINILVLRSREFNTPKYYLAYHDAVHGWGNYSVLSGDVRLICKQLNLTF